MALSQQLEKRTQRKQHLWMCLFCLAGIALLMLWHDLALAGGSKDLKGISEGVSTQVKAVANLLVIVAYVAGVGFALAGVVQFKAHKDNPAQVPLSKPIVYLVVGACLLFLPTIMQAAGETVFGGGQSAGVNTAVDQSL